jgi:glycosyltransferase involved in cell wall biosynthesis
VTHSVPGTIPVTPIVLTRDEGENLERTLRSLAWARRVLVLDSGSTDRTEAIAQAQPNVVFDAREFKGWGEQWTHALRHPAVEDRWVLALDADMVVPEDFVKELRERFVPGAYAGGRVRFRYAVGGRTLFGSLYPPDLRVLDRERARAAGHGHRHVFEVDGPVYKFRSRVLHDDRKGLDRFVATQLGYAAREEARIRAGEGLRWRDRLRRRGWLAPWVFALAYLRAGGPLKGRAALRYAHERALYEALLALRLLRDPEGADEGRGERPGSPR